MNERERKELAALVADCCKPCRSRIETWIKGREVKAKAKAKPGELTARGLARLLGSLPKANNLVRFSSEGYVEGTDGEAWARFKVKVGGEGEAVVDGRAIARWLQTRNSSPITVTVEETEANTTGGVNGLTIEAGGLKVGFLKALVHLPPAPKVPGANMGTARAAALAEAVKSVQFSASDREMRYAMNGIAFDGEELATTNGRSLAAVAVSGLKKLGEKEQAAIFPLRHVRPLLAVLRANGEARLKVARRAEGEAEARREYMRIGGSAGSITVYAIDGRFPAWREVVPTRDPAAALFLDAGELASAFNSIAALTAEDSESKATRVEVKGSDVTLTHSNGRTESVQVHGKANGQGESVAYLNPHYMMDALKTQKGEVAFEVRGEEEAVMLKAGSWQYVLMPITPRD